jgi:hypothetical protein
MPLPVASLAKTRTRARTSCGATASLPVSAARASNKLTTDEILALMRGKR